MKIDNKLLLENSKDLTVLYVEDDDVLRESTINLLATFFSSVDSAKDGSAGLALYKKNLKNTKNNYDLVIADIEMPKMNGIEMCQKIKSIDPTQMIIFVTAYNEVDYLNSAIELGVRGFITKPIETENLKSVLYKVTQMIADRKLVRNYYEQIEEQNMLHINQKDASDYTSGKNILKDLEANKEYISKLWTDKKIVHERLESHFIDVEFFRTHYAIKVIEYFLSVIREENEAGNCPVIFIMLDFFKNKNLPLEDIFMVCVLFKNTLSSYVFDRYTFNHVLFDDISNILDKNFEGVIINYLDMKYTDKADEKKTLKEPAKIDKEEPTIVEEEVVYREYVLEHDIYELQDLEEEIDGLAISVTESAQAILEDFDTLGNQITRYGSILTNYPIFSELGKYISKLGINFSSKAQVLYDDKERMRNIASLIEGFVNDLIVWRREVFDNNINDPHFLDQSFFSNVDTIIMFIEYDESAATEEDDFDDMFF